MWVRLVRGVYHFVCITRQYDSNQMKYTGTVLPAVDENGRVVALKTFSVSTLMATNMYEAVTKELTVMCRLNKAGGHKNVIRIHELFESKDKIYLSMELARGGSFLDMLRGKVSTQMPGRCLFDLNTARKLFRQLLQGVLHMHRHNIVRVVFVLDLSTRTTTHSISLDEHTGTQRYQT